MAKVFKFFSDISCLPLRAEKYFNLDNDKYKKGFIKLLAFINLKDLFFALETTFSKKLEIM